MKRRAKPTERITMTLEFDFTPRQKARLIQLVKDNPRDGDEFSGDDDLRDAAAAAIDVILYPREHSESDITIHSILQAAFSRSTTGRSTPIVEPRP